jgi:tetratricopeptide (TPR) repeat protein
VGGYGVREVASILGLSEARVRSYVRAGFLRPARGPRGALRFSFQDILVLRTAQGLVAARIPERRVKRALRKLRGQLPEGRPLTGVQVVAEGDRIVVHDGSSRWQPESGQVLFDWYERAWELEDAAPDQAREAYRRALELDPDHGGALVNLGRLLHAAGAPGVAEAHYRRALSVHPDDATAAFNLGVVLEDQGKLAEALESYERAVRLDPLSADAHYNAALLSERLGDEAAALRHLKVYRRLTKTRR